MENKTIRELLIEKDEVSLVDLDGNILGREDKYKAHEFPAKLHKAISVWLMNANSEVLFQQRSAKKIVGGGWWANTVCGNVWPTESYFECAHRRLRVELGILNAKIEPIFKFVYKAYGNEKYNEHELDQVYAGFFNEEVKKNQDEVSDYCWINLNELLNKISEIEYISSEQTLLLADQELKTKTSPVEIQLQGKVFVIAPWTVMMLKNSQLINFFAKFE